jgi:hypothetical protein
MQRCKPKDKKNGSDDEEKATSRLFEIHGKDAKRANIKPSCTKRKDKAKLKYANLSKSYSRQIHWQTDHADR